MSKLPKIPHSTQQTSQPHVFCCKYFKIVSSDLIYEVGQWTTAVCDSGTRYDTSAQYFFSMKPRRSLRVRQSSAFTGLHNQILRGADMTSAGKWKVVGHVLQQAQDFSPPATGPFISVDQ